MNSGIASLHIKLRHARSLYTLSQPGPDEQPLSHGMESQSSLRLSLELPNPFKFSLEPPNSLQHCLNLPSSLIHFMLEQRHMYLLRSLKPLLGSLLPRPEQPSSLPPSL